MDTFFDLSFWQSFLSNLFATFIGAVLGILGAVYVNGLLEKSSEKERKRKILVLLSEELNENLSLLSNWNALPNPKEEVAVVGYDIKTEVWDSFSDGGEIQWIKDPELLGILSNAFFRLKNMRELGSWSDSVLSSINYTTEPLKNKAWERLMKKYIPCAESVSKAIIAVQKILNKK